MSDPVTSSGVQDLIDRLSQEGVAEGQKQADTILAEAQGKADKILDQAREQANEILAQARSEADQFRKSGEDALRLACRDAVRDLENQIHEGFSAKLKELVAYSLDDTEVLKKMICEVARKSAPEKGSGPVEILIPDDALSDKQIRSLVKSGSDDALVKFVRELTGDAVRKGITLRTSALGQPGVRVRFLDDRLQIDMTEGALTDLLAQHLLPRFREVLRHA